MNGFWIILDTSHGELDRVFVENEDQIQSKIQELLMISEWIITVGDIIRITEGWSETD